MPLRCTTRRAVAAGHAEHGLMISINAAPTHVENLGCASRYIRRKLAPNRAAPHNFSSDSMVEAVDWTCVTGTTLQIVMPAGPH